MTYSLTSLNQQATMNVEKYQFVRGDSLVTLII